MSTIRKDSIWGRLAIIATLGLFAGMSVPAHAAFIVNIADDGSGNVVATGSGTIDTGAFSFSESTSISFAFISGSGSTLYMGTGAARRFTGITGPSSFGSGTNQYTYSYSGNFVGLEATSLVLPSSYVSGNPLSNTETWTGQTISGLGLTPGTYEWTWGSGATADSFTLNIGEDPPPATPEPASASMLLIGAGALGFVGLRRRKTQTQNINL